MISGPANWIPPERGEDPAEVDRPLPDRHVLVDPPPVVRELGGVDALAERAATNDAVPPDTSSECGDVEGEPQIGRADPVEERLELLHLHPEILELGVAGQGFMFSMTSGTRRRSPYSTARAMVS